MWGTESEVMGSADKENKSTEPAGETTVSDNNNAEMTLVDRLSRLDKFEVKWAGRDSKGNFRLDSTVFEVVDAPAPFYGQNVRDFGVDTAMKMAEDAEWDADHDFGHCYIRPNSLRLERRDGSWYIDLTVDPHKCRYPQVTTMLVDENGNPILDDAGNRQIRTAPRKEGWITVRLDQVRPVTDHPLASEYRQRDTRSRALLNANAQSERIASGKAKGGRSKGKRKRLTPAQIAALLG